MTFTRNALLNMMRDSLDWLKRDRVPKMGAHFGADDESEEFSFATIVEQAADMLEKYAPDDEARGFDVCPMCNNHRWMVRNREVSGGYLSPEVYGCPECNQDGSRKCEAVLTLEATMEYRKIDD